MSKRDYWRKRRKRQRRAEMRRAAYAGLAISEVARVFGVTKGYVERALLEPE